MGTGSGHGLKYREEEALEEIARKSLKEGAEPEKHNVFISFIKEDEKEVNLLRGQAKNENSSLEFNDYSVKEPFDSEKAEYIRRGIRERIKQCSVTFIFLSADTANSKWVDWEIRESVKLGKGVVAMYSANNPPTNISRALKELNIKPVPWNHDAIAKAIHKAAKKRT